MSENHSGADPNELPIAESGGKTCDRHLMNSAKTRETLKQNLLHRAADLGQAALLPAEKSELDALVRELETLNPTPSPLALENRSLLLGSWKLIYASSGTVVTRRLSNGIPIHKIWQVLSPLNEEVISDAGSFEKLATINSIELELPLLGKLQIQAKGLWQWQGATPTATVAFDAFSLQATGFHQSNWQLPALQIPILEWMRREASWRTSYLDADLRIGRGATGNGFVFVRS